jgi:DNA repair exonuclease SbcCD ATPase subunit
MLKSLKFGVQFYNLDGSKGFGCLRDIKFANGMTAITGLNGEGKSLVPEMIQFAYFGIAALRGVADDYKEMWVEHECEIKGQPLTIHRTISKATLYEGHDIDTKTAKKLASGTKAVNQAIKDLFGYSMNVFQVANAINQKQVDQFCAMLPTARKKLVDETIGLSALDALVKWIGEKETNLKASINARAGLLREPVAPTMPEGYRAEAEILPELQALKAHQLARNGVKARAAMKVEFPPVVALEPDDDKLDQYQEQQQRYVALVTEAALLQRDFDALGPVPSEARAITPEVDDAKLDQYRGEQTTRVQVQAQRNALAQQFNAIPVTPYTAERLDECEAANKLRNRWLDKQALMAAGIGYHCDKCGHDGHMHDPRVEDEFGDVPDAEPEGSVLSDDTIIRQRAILARQQERADLERQVFECDEFLSVNPDRADRIRTIEATRREIEAQRVAIQKQLRHIELTERRVDLGNRLVANPACQNLIDLIMKKRHAHALYQAALTQAHKRQQEVEQAQAELAQFPATLDDDLQNLENVRYLSLVYETNQRAYLAAKETYDAEMIQQKELEDELSEWAKGKQAISDLRTRVKAFLLPSLNKVATYLLQEFTGGVLKWIVINDDFEVLVDGKRVEVLNGGSKTVANLAIRIGLGQVLTNQVFPVLMADEPDESCDDNRAVFIEKTLGALRERMKQVILITHKTGESADHHIHFG